MRYLSHQEVFNKQFCFIRCRRQQLQAVEKRRYSRFTFVEIPVSHLPKVLRAKFLGSDRPFCFISICKFDGFKTFFAMITSLCELYFRFRRYILLVKMKRVISMSYGSSKSRWKPQRRLRLDLIFTIRDTYINPNQTHPQNSLAAAEALSFKISSDGTSLNWSQRLSHLVWE